jgi:hypothetical protein
MSSSVGVGRPIRREVAVNHQDRTARVTAAGEVEVYARARPSTSRPGLFALTADGR